MTIAAQKVLKPVKTLTPGIEIRIDKDPEANKARIAEFDKLIREKMPVAEKALKEGLQAFADKDFAKAEDALDSAVMLYFDLMNAYYAKACALDNIHGDSFEAMNMNVVVHKKFIDAWSKKMDARKELQKSAKQGDG